jgi:hypothetical protein
VGDDGHVGIDYFTDKSCCADDCQGDEVVNYDVHSISQSRENCDLCLDFSVQQCEAVFFKRLKRIPTISSDTVTPKSLPQMAARDINQVVGWLMPPLQARISQTILAHRTVVLRN